MRFSRNAAFMLINSQALFLSACQMLSEDTAAYKLTKAAQEGTNHAEDQMQS